MVNLYTANTLRYDRELCNNCGMCSTVCPHGVFEPGPESAELANPEECMECGACQKNCPTGAVSVESGVGCATAMIFAALTGQKEVCCGPRDPSDAEKPAQQAPSCCGGSASPGLTAKSPGAAPSEPSSCCGAAPKKTR